MCGIAGYFNKKSSQEDVLNTIKKMNNIQIHRGPNSHDHFLNAEKNLGLIMCRLSILDLELGIQPMTSKDGRYTIIFNGTILNSPELRKKLEKIGVKFFTNNSDTEVLLQMMINHGKEALKELNGSFSFAFYDNIKKKLFCARDRFGLTPFYYYWKNGKFLFASELKAILYSNHCSNDIDIQSLNDFLSLLWVPGPKTIIKDIKKLPAGHILEIDLNKEKLKIQEWWDIEILDQNYPKLDTLIEELRYVLEKSVIRSTLSDVPLACGLSGGLDSQAITGLLAKNNININTFTLGFKGFKSGDLNETKLANIAAKHFRTNHTEVAINTKDYFEDLDKMIYHLDEPYGGGLPLWHILKQSGKKFGVILTGLGGDELFGNFGRWTLLEKTMFNLFNNKYQFDTLFFNRKYFFSEKLKNKIILKNSSNPTSQYLLSIMNKKKYYDIRNKIMYLDLKTQLQDEYCNVVNKFSMANQIEARAPFLDNEFTNLMFKISSKIRTSKKDFKYLLRNILKGLIPDQNLYNRKIGFIGLESQKMNYNFFGIRNILFNKKKIDAQSILNHSEIQKFIIPFENGGQYKENINFFKKKYSYKSLWALIMFQKWYDIFIEKKNDFQIELKN